jgi:isopentenyldiphosphate isomerase
MPELLDVCDHEGHLTGQVLARSEVHKAQAWHRVALVWVINSRGEILLSRRAEHLNLFPGLWDVTVSGHVSAGDEPTPTAVRETQEEVGLTTALEEMKFIDTVTDRLPTSVPERLHQEYDFIYVARHDVAADKLKLQAAEILEVRWVTADDYERELRDPIASKQHSQRNDDVYWAVLNEARKLQGAAV